MHDRCLVVELLRDVRDREGLERVLELATVMVIVGSSIISRELGQARATHLLDDIVTTLPPMRGDR
jgi:hypothetical protein